MVRQRASRAHLWLKLFALVAANAVLVTQAVDSAAAADPVVQAAKKNVCSVTVSSDDASVGIAVVTDVACKSGGLGCFQDVCRFCKARSTPQSQHLLGCEKIFGSTVSPQATSAPALSPSGGAPQCTSKVSPGDAGVGVDLVTDLTCRQDGLGCFQDVCRFCKRKNTPQSQHFFRCDQIAPAPVATASPRPTAKPTPTPAPKPIATTSIPSPAPAIPN